MLSLFPLITMAGRRVQDAQTIPNGPTLQTYLAEHAWNESQRGPMLALDPARAVATSLAPGIAGFGLREMRVGKLLVWAPADMVTLESEPKGTPSLYDGLPRAGKVLYLASLFSSSQWSVAASQGIGLGDMNEEQRSVFRTILPREFTFRSRTLQAEGRLEPASDGPAETTLSPEEEAHVRLKLYKDIGLGVRLANGKGTSTVPITASEARPIGSIVLTRKEDGDQDTASLFGMKIRRVVPNVPKASDLDFRDSALDTRVPLRQDTTVGELCREVGSASGMTIVADERTGKTPVRAYGSSARAGDVLQGLALCLAGTFRRVGGTYALASDLEGVGAKRMKIAEWAWDLGVQAQTRLQSCRGGIADSGGTLKLSSDLPNALEPSESMVRFIDSGFAPGQSSFLVSDMPPIWQSIFKAGRERFGSNSVRPDVVEPFASMSWGFVLPDGRPLAKESSLGRLSQFRRRPKSDARSGSTLDANSAPGKGGLGRALLYESNAVATVRALAPLARLNGMAEVWLQTSRAECVEELVRSCKSAGLLCRFVLSPWSVPSGSAASVPDRSIAGATLAEAIRLQSRTAWWKENSHAWEASLPRPSATYAPNDPALVGYWNDMTALARSPGLDGCVLLETEPPGYEPALGTAAYAPAEMTALTDLGYTDSLREAFLRDRGVDPVDLVDERLDVRALDFSIPYFSPEGRPAKDRAALDAWAKRLNDTNKAAMAKLTNRLAGSVLFEARHEVRSVPHWGPEWLVNWDRTNEPPSTTKGTFDESAIPTQDYRLWRVPSGDDDHATLKALMGYTLRTRASGGATALDFRSLPFDQLARLLNR